MESMIANAINAASKKAIKVENTPEPTKNNKETKDIPYFEYYGKPNLHLDTKDFPGVKDFIGGQTVTLCIECLVENTNYSKTVDETGEKEERTSARLQILSIGDLTQFSTSILKK